MSPQAAALGPENTFCDLAARSWCAAHPLNPGIILYPTIRQTFNAVGNDCRWGVLPIENLVEGYVQPVLDLLLHGRLFIQDEMLLPIRFAFVATVPRPDMVRRIYAQFVTRGQCSAFLESLGDIPIVTTESNAASFELMRQGREGDGALIPSHMLANTVFPCCIENVNDYRTNLTRFIVVGDDLPAAGQSCGYKTSLVIIEGMDRPGMLGDILRGFSRRSINLVAIMSRPTKESMGQYHFFVDIEGDARNPDIADALEEIREYNDVKLLGTYPRAAHPAAPS